MRADAAAGAAAGRLTDRVVAALVDGGWFRLFLPADLGGPNLALPDACRSIARVAEADGSAGWAVMIGAGPNWFAGRMTGALASAVFGPPNAVVAGSGAPGSARATTGGWRVSGRWRWCSGAPWATWFTFGVGRGAGDPFAVAVPAEDVELHPGTWDVSGLRASASWDVSVDGATVPDARTFRIDAPPTRPEPVFAVPFPAFAQATMAAVTVGIARRALAEFRRLARDKVPFGATTTLADDPVTRHRFAACTAATRAAARGLDAATLDAWDAVVDSGTLDAATALELELAARHAVGDGARLGATLGELAGMTVLARDDPLGRAIADLHAAGQNAAVSPTRFGAAGGTLLAGS